MEMVVLVDELDREVGTMEKMEAHRLGRLHRAFSILLFNRKGELLIQKRANTKYHSAGLWTNTCCSHPRPDEPMEKAIRRKLLHEMGIEAHPAYSHKFIYKTTVGELIENELDHIFTGKFDGEPVINAEEVEDWKYISVPNLILDIQAHPEKYTYWFKLIVKHKEFESMSLNS